MYQSVRITEEGEYDSTPTYLFDYSDLYKDDPIEAGRSWFREARYGLGVSFGLHSLLGKGQRAMQEMQISRSNYENLKDTLKAEHFDATDLVQFTIANGMRYLDFTVRSSDGFCLWNTQTTDFNCATSPAKRDFLAEIASVCEFEGIGLCIRYQHGEDGRFEGSLDEEGYFEQTAKQLTELLTQYGPIAALCLEGAEATSPCVGERHVADLYKLVRAHQPQLLLSYEQGLLGDEEMKESTEFLPHEPQKLRQLKASLTPGHWSYHAESAGKHLKESDVAALLKESGKKMHNLLINTNLMPDGSLDLEDIDTLLALGKKIQQKGFPR